MNLLWCVVDCLRYDCLNPEHSDRGTVSKNLDYASDYVWFEDAFSQSAYTLTVSSSMFSGLYPPTHNTLSIHDSFPKEFSGIGDFLQQEIDVFSGMNFFSGDWGLDALFDTVHSLDQVKAQYECKQARADEVVDAFLNQDLSKGFGSILWFFDAHKPYQSPFPKEANPKDRYLNEVAFIKEQLNRLMSELHSRDLYDDTMIIITGDHGELFEDHPLLQHSFLSKSSKLPLARRFFYRDGYLGHLAKPLYDELIHIPMGIKFPDQRWSNTNIAGLVEHIDLLPTVLHEFDNNKEMLPGIPLQKIITGDKSTKQKVFGMMKAHIGNATSFSVRSEDFKLVRMEPPDRSISSLWKNPYSYVARRYLTKEQRLYELPSEDNDVSTDFKEKTSHFEMDLDEWLEYYSRKQISETQTLTEKRKEELRNLGYL
jgi:arylsulfatase A-like enzyme